VRALGSDSSLLGRAGLPTSLDSGAPDPGQLLSGSHDADARPGAFVAAVAQHRHSERETDLPRV
jgi:catalase